MPKTPTPRRPTQLNLFRPRLTVPTWSTLPTEVRQKVKALLTRLLRDHRAGHLRRQGRREAGDE